jgi:peptidoglycan/xylan/chitin deacetylase (PgdA/CDA1 family)
VRLIEALRRHGTPTTGFVTCDSVRIEPAVLRRWSEAGYELGNHTARHRDIDHGPGERWRADVAGCHVDLTAMSGRPPRFFRFPYLHYGSTAERKRDAAAKLGSLGYRIAHVTIIAHDWLFAEAYGEAVRQNDAARAATLAEDLVAHVLEATERARAESRTRFGREIAQILLLHANLLLADHAPQLLEALARSGARFVALNEALDDPVYALDDLYVGPATYGWLDRIAPPAAPAQPWDVTQDRALGRRPPGLR